MLLKILNIRDKIILNKIIVLYNNNNKYLMFNNLLITMKNLNLNVIYHKIFSYKINIILILQ